MRNGDGFALFEMPAQPKSGPNPDPHASSCVEKQKPVGCKQLCHHIGHRGTKQQADDHIAGVMGAHADPAETNQNSDHKKHVAETRRQQ